MICNALELKPLADLPSGGSGRIGRVEGTSRLRLRLAALGVVPGVELDIIRGGNGAKQPLLLGVRGSRLAVGPDVAQLVMVQG